MLLFWHRCLGDHTRKRTAGSQEQSHAASHPSATAFTFCHHSGGIAPRHYGYFPVLSAFRCEIKTVREWESEKLKRRERERQSAVRGSWQREWQMLWTKRGENMWLVDHRPLTLTRPPWKRHGYHGYWGRLQEKRMGVKPTYGKLSPVWHSYRCTHRACLFIHTLPNNRIFMSDM